jgi:hypothetical protein
MYRAMMVSRPSSPRIVFSVYLSIAWAKISLFLVCMWPPTFLVLQGVSYGIAKDAVSRTPLTSVPFEYIDGHIFIVASVGGMESMRFLVDTGSSDDALSLKSAQKLGLQIARLKRKNNWGLGEDGFSFAGSKTMPIAVGSLMLNDKIRIIDLQLSQPLLQEELSGILGEPIFRHYVVELNFERKKLSVYDAGEYRYKGSGEIIPVRMKESLPTIPVLLGMADGERLAAAMTIDTGSDATLLFYRKFILTHQMEHRVGETAVGKSQGLGGAFAIESGKIQDATIGPYIRMSDILIFFSEANRGFGARTKIDGAIGNAILSKFSSVIFDLPQGQIIFSGRLNQLSGRVSP